MALNLTARIGLDGSGFTGGLRRLEGAASGFGSRVSSTLKSAFGPIMAVFSVAAITRAAQKTIDWGSATSDLAESIGITSEELQELEYAARKTGGSVETVVKAFARMSQFRNEALTTKASRAGKIAEAIGISREELAKLDTTTKLFDRLAEVFRTTDFGAAQAGLLRDIFGRGGLELLPLFTLGVSKLRGEAHALGVVVRNDIVFQLDEIKDKQEQIIQQLRVPMANALTSVYQGLLWVVEKFQEMSPAITAANDAMKALVATGSKLAAYRFFTEETRKKHAASIIGKTLSDMVTLGLSGVLGGAEGGGRRMASDEFLAKLLELQGGGGEGAAKTATQSRLAALGNYSAPSDALARIGGFTSTTGAARAQSAVVRTADAVEKIEKKIDRGFNLVGRSGW